MGLFNNLFGNKKNNDGVNNISNNIKSDNTTNTNFSNINLKKEESLKKVNLRKESISKICLEKKELTNLTARVAVVLDYSGSMDRMYYDGTVQSILERLLPIALNFDDNGELETWIFEKNFNRLKDININNYYNYIKNENILEKYYMGGTHYAPVIEDILYKHTKEEPSNIPTLVLFLTDGDNFDKPQTTKAIQEASKYPIFWQFIGLGNKKFSFLENLDNMKDRYIDNANFFAINDINKISDDELYKKLLNEYPSWITEAKKKNILK